MNGAGGLFAELPPEMAIEILSRLPDTSIPSCRCVCKRWMELIGTREFALAYRSKSIPVLAIKSAPSDSCRIIECIEANSFQEIQTVTNVSHHELHSANGLLLYREGYRYHVCNPLTREKILIPHPPYYSIMVLYRYPRVAVGFGRYKIVCILHEERPPSTEFKVHDIIKVTADKSKCMVYKIGSGSWRTFPIPFIRFCYSFRAAFFNGRLHWIVMPTIPVLSVYQISCFDVETEEFTIFDAPRCRPSCGMSVSDFEGFLCVCESGTDEGFVIWLMREYGDETSWVKRFVSGVIPDFREYIFRPIKIFNDGKILMTTDFFTYGFLFVYSDRDKTCGIIQMNDSELEIHHAVRYVPSQVSLRSFQKEGGVIFGLHSCETI